MNRAELDRICSGLVRSGASRVDPAKTVEELGKAGRSMAESIYILAEVYGMSMADAKERVVLSSTWRGEMEVQERFHDRLARSLGDDAAE